MDSKLKCVFEMPVESTSVSSTGTDVIGNSFDSTRVIGDSVRKLLV